MEKKTRQSAVYHLNKRGCGMRSLFFFWARSQNFENTLLASLCLSICPSVRMEQLESHWTDFYEILISHYFSKINLTRIMGTLLEDLCTFVTIDRSFLLSVRNVSDKCYSENKNTHFMLITFSFSNHAFSEVVWKGEVDADRQTRFRERPRYYVSTYSASLFLYRILWFFTKTRP